MDGFAADVATSNTSRRVRGAQAIDSSIITPEDLPEGEGSIQHRERLGGVLNRYYRAAA